MDCNHDKAHVQEVRDGRVQVSCLSCSAVLQIVKEA